MTKSSHKKSNLLAQKNKVRGLISRLHARKFSSGMTGVPASTIRSVFRSIFLESRALLRPNQYRGFLEWTESQVKSQIPDFIRTPIGFDELRGVSVDAPDVKLNTELLWVSERIRAAGNRINAFRDLAIEVEKLTFCGEFENAIKKLVAIEDDCGASFWSIQLRIALEHQAGGLDRQKRYSAKIRSIFGRGLLTFIGFHTSARNEDKATIGNYIDVIENRIENHPYYDDSVKTYLYYKLGRQSPKLPSGFSDILKVEQSHSLIDLYETFVYVIQEVLQREDMSAHRDTVEKSLRSLDGIDDYRLTKARILLHGSVDRKLLANRDYSASDQLIMGNPRPSLHKSRRICMGREPVDPWPLIYAGFGNASLSNKLHVRHRRPKDVSRLLGCVASRADTAFDAKSVLAKLALNFCGLPSFAGIRDFLEQIISLYPDNEIRPWIVGLNSPTIGVEDIPTQRDSYSVDLAMYSMAATPTSVSWNSFRDPACEFELPSQHARIFTMAGLLRANRYDEAIDLIDQIETEVVPAPVKSLATSGRLHAKYSVGARQDVIEIIVKEGTKGFGRRKLLPIQNSLGSYVWHDYKLLQSRMSSAVALHLLWSENESRTTESLLRFATREFLAKLDSGLPSSLYDQADDFPPRELIYFLSRVCIPKFMDHAAAFRGTDDLMEERQKVCAALRFLDPTNADVYQEEIAEIAQRKAMIDGQWIVDRTRIHVDTDAMKRWAKKELSESFNRYLDLLDIDPSVDVDLDHILNEIMATPVVPNDPAAPKTEAEVVLVSLLEKLGDQFLENPSFGLDFYLSKRIRHQSFIGLIRGPAEFAHLITTRESLSGVYRRNDHWLSKLEDIEREPLEAIEEAFLKFSEKFDSILGVAKDTKFQIRSKHHPDGLVYLQFYRQHIYMLSKVSSAYTTLSEFVDLVATILWTSVEPSLSRVRKYIGEDIKTSIVQSFDELRASVRKHAGNQSATFLELDPVIGKCSADVQTQLDVAAQWFTRIVDINAMQQVFELEQMVTIAIESSLRCQRAFEPQIEKKVHDGDVKMAVSTLIFLHDVLFVALDNVRAHSGLKKPEIAIVARIDQEEETLELEIISDVSRNVDHDRAERNIEDIRVQIANHDFERKSSIEGGSGFVKLAAVATQHEKGSIEFGFQNNDVFRLGVTYSLNIESIPLEDHSE